MISCFEAGSRAEPSPKSHHPLLPPDERLWKLTVSPSASQAKLAIGLAGLITLSIRGEAYIMTAPERSPASVPSIVLTQPLSLPPPSVFVSPMVVLRDRIRSAQRAERIR